MPASRQPRLELSGSSPDTAILQNDDWRSVVSDRQPTPAEEARTAAEERAQLAEARKFEAEASVFEAQATAARILADREVDKRERELHAFEHQRIFTFIGQVDEAACAKCVAELNHWHQLDPECDIEILFNSPGGSVFAGMALYDYIQEMRRRGHKITTSTRGMAASMGGILLQAGDIRVMGAEAYILIHEISAHAGGKIGDIEDTVELLKKMEERVLEIFASRSALTKAKLKANWRRKDWWIDSTEALKLGLVDEVR